MGVSQYFGWGAPYLTWGQAEANDLESRRSNLGEPPWFTKKIGGITVKGDVKSRPADEASSRT